MSRINWLKASLKGRLGEVVGSSWRGKDYTKVYTPPRNPHTAGQTEVRTIFAHVGHIAHMIYKGVLDPYTYPVPREITKYNRMMQINHELYDDKVWAPGKLKIFAGELQGAPITSAQYREADDELKVYWEAEFGDTDDIVAVVVYYEITDSVLYSVGGRREESPAIIETGQIGKALDVTKMHVYLAFAQPPSEKNGNQGMVSNTTYSVVTPYTATTDATT
jgi:hypothetical protein